MSKQFQTQAKATSSPATSFIPPQSGLVQRKCACGESSSVSGSCAGCDMKQLNLQRSSTGENESATAPPIVHEVLRSSGKPVDGTTRAFMEPRFGHDFSQVRIHTDARAAESAHAVNALAYTVGNDIVFGENQYAPDTTAGRRILAHELRHVAQQIGSGAGAPAGSLQVGDSDSPLEREADAAAEQALNGGYIQRMSVAAQSIQRLTEPYINRITVNLTPPESASLTWSGTAPTTPGSDSFTVSTGKGYSDPDDPPGSCTRTCCGGAATQCAPPFNQPEQVGSCCTPIGNNFYTGRTIPRNNGWQWWTPVEPLHTRMNRGIALHQHDTVTGDAIGHGCIRMDEPNAHRIALYARGRATNVTITGQANPVSCPASRQCGATGAVQQTDTEGQRFAELSHPDEELPGGGGSEAEMAPEEEVLV